MGRFQKKDSALLVSLGQLLGAGLRSRRRAIVNLSVETWNSTFGKEEALLYPTVLSSALARLRDIVPLSAPGLNSLSAVSLPLPHSKKFNANILQKEDVSFDSDSSVDVAIEKRSSPVKHSPYRAARMGRKSRSPAVPKSEGKRSAAKPTPKSRLRHEDSQIRFEPIASSPTNPFNQESQVLTARQRDMMERQKSGRSLYAKFISSQDGGTPTEELPPELSRTPLKNLAAMEGMDVFLGSSPTPQARASTYSQHSQQVLSDTTDLNTPTAVRTVQMAEQLELGSSPPRFEQESSHASRPSAETSRRQHERSFSSSFDAGSPFDEDALPVSSSFQGAPTSTREGEFAMEFDNADVPSSTIELQIDAQLTADLSARKSAPIEESNTVYVDARSQPKPDMPTKSPAPEKATEKVTKSLKSAATDERPVQESDAISSPRRSARKPAVSTPAEEPPVKRKRGRPPKSSKKKGKGKAEGTPAREPQPQPQPQLVPAKTPAAGATSAEAASTISKGKRKRTRSQPDAEPSSPSLIPETVVKPALGKTASTLSQVMTNEADGVDETPLAKRTRKNAKQDVSDAKAQAATPAQPTAEAKNKQKEKQKQLSHVQVTLKGPSSSSRASSVATGEDTAMLDVTTQRDHTTLTQNLPSQPQLLASSQPPDGTSLAPVDSQAGPASTNAPNSQAFKDRVIATPKSIIAKLRQIKDYCQGLVLGREEEREIDEVLFDVRKAVHDAGNRGIKQMQKKGKERE